MHGLPFTTLFGWHLLNWEHFRILWLAAYICICRVNSLNILRLSRHTINLSAFSSNNKILSQPTGLYPVLRRLWSWSWREEPTLTQSLVCRTRFDTKSGQVFSLHAPLQAHVLKTGSGLYSVVLGAVNIQDGKNSYYKLQILEHDKKPKWCVIDLGSFSQITISPSGGFSALGAEWGPPSEAQNLRWSISVHRQPNGLIMLCYAVSQLRDSEYCFQIRSSSRSMMPRETLSSNMRTRQETSGRIGTTFKRSSCALQ